MTKGQKQEAEFNQGLNFKQDSKASLLGTSLQSWKVIIRVIVFGRLV